MNAPWNSGMPANRDSFSAYICDDAALDVLRPVVIELGWQAETPFAELVRIMVEADLEAQEQASGRRRGGPGTR